MAFDHPAADASARGPDRTAPAAGGAAYILGVIGAATYYIGAANGFWWGVVGLLKALVWPAFLVYELLAHARG